LIRRAALFVTAVAAAGIAVAGALYYMTRPNELSVAVGPPGSEDVRVMTAVAQILRRERADVRLRIEIVDGPAEAATALDRGRADLAVIRSDLSVPTTGQTLAILHRNAAVLVAPGDSGIAAVSDLAGRKVGILRATVVNEKLLDTILGQYEVPSSEVQRIGLAPEEVFSAVGSRRIDALLVVGPITGTIMNNAIAAVAGVGATPPRFVPVSEADAIAQRMPAYDSTTIVRGAFGGTPPKPSEPVPTIAAVYRLVANAKLDEAVVADFVRHLFEMRTDLAAAVPAADRIEAPDTEKGSATPVHPGAAAYLDGTEHGFFDRYGDWIYLLAMVGGVFGSIAAALVGRLRSRTVEQAIRLEHLLRIMREARLATSPATLDRLEQEADDVFADTLNVAAHSQVDTQRLAAFSLALEQVRQAISDRRRMIGPEGTAPHVVTPLRAAGE
jgi:TRAP transporter TAXI family solute receptor